MMWMLRDIWRAGKRCFEMLYKSSNNAHKDYCMKCATPPCWWVEFSKKLVVGCYVLVKTNVLTPIIHSLRNYPIRQVCRVPNSTGDGFNWNLILWHSFVSLWTAHKFQIWCNTVFSYNFQWPWRLSNCFSIAYSKGEKWKGLGDYVKSMNLGVD